MTITSYSIKNDFVVLSPDKNASVENFDEGMYARLDENYNNFRGHELVSCHEFEQDWGSWEIHPHGDEIVVLLSGRASFVLQLENGEKTVELDEAGKYVIVPRNVWHTAKTKEKTSMLFITPGEDTQHKQD